MKLPTCEAAIVEEIKLTGYLLHEVKSKGKHTFYERIGFGKNNFQLLCEAFSQLACEGEVIGEELTKFGTKYQVAGPFQNPLGRDIHLLSIWMIESESSIPRLVTAYPF